MTERDKIINIVEQNKYCDVNTVANCRECKYSKELENYKDMGCSSLKTADALIAAGIGDVTEYKKTIRDLNTDVVAYRALSKANTLEQIIEGQKSLIDEYKHRAEVTERANPFTLGTSPNSKFMTHRENWGGLGSRVNMHVKITNAIPITALGVRGTQSLARRRVGNMWRSFSLWYRENGDTKTTDLTLPRTSCGVIGRSSSRYGD